MAEVLDDSFNVTLDLAKLSFLIFDTVVRSLEDREGLDGAVHDISEYSLEVLINTGNDTFTRFELLLSAISFTEDTMSREFELKFGFCLKLPTGSHMTPLGTY